MLLFLANSLADTQGFLNRPCCNRCNKPLTCDRAILYRENMKPYLNAAEVARLLDIDRATVTRWIRKGMIKGVQRPEGTGQWRIPLSSYAALVKHESR